MANNLDRYFNEFNERFNTIVPNLVAETATEFFKNKFKTQEWEGNAWQALSPKYAAKKTVGRGRVLTRTGILQASIRPSVVTNTKVTISAGGAKIPYARVHNEGLRIQGVRNVKSYTNNNFMGTGRKQQIKAHRRRVDYRMPQRQFMGNSPTLNNLLRARIIAALNAGTFS